MKGIHPSTTILNIDIDMLIDYKVANEQPDDVHCNKQASRQSLHYFFDS